MIRVLLVDDHPVVREGLAAVLSDDPDIKIVGSADSGEAALNAVAQSRPDVAVVDLRLRGINGIETCKEIRRRSEATRVVVLTSFPSDGAVLGAFEVGASAFVLKESEPTILREAVRIASRGQTFADPRIAGALVAFASGGRRAKGPFGLTLQEMRVLERLPKGLTNREIADELGIGHNTVKTHLSNAMHKMKAKDRVEAAAIAMREGLA